MRFSFPLFVGLRYLASQRKQRFISFISLISILGVTTGVMAMVVILSVMTGLQQDLREKILGTNAHVVFLQSGAAIESYRELEQELKAIDPAQVLGTTPFIYNQAMVTTNNNVMGAVVRGIDPQSITTVTKLEQYMVQGALESITAPVAATVATDDAVALPGLIIGKELATNLGLALYDEVNIVSPTGSVGPMGITPRIKRFRISGVFSSGMYEYDSGLVYISLTDAQRFFNMGDRITGIEIKIKDPMQSDALCWKIQEQIGFPYYCRDWKDLNKNLFGALMLEKIGMTLILVLIITVAAFNIVSTLFMVVLQKGREIAILKSMGATSHTIRQIFMFQGVLIGSIGSCLGGILGLILCQLLDRYQFIQLPKDIYYIDRLPVLVDPLQVAAILLGAVALSFLATIYPAHRAASLDPVEGIRYGGEA